MNMVKLKNITLRKWEKLILDNISWDIQKGQHWAVLGLNGSGKTSLLKLITGYDWPSRGTVSVFGHTYGTCNLQEVRKAIGWVSNALDDRFQARGLDRVLDIVLTGKRASIGLYEEVSVEEIEQAEQILEKFNILHLRNEPLHILSQGEKRKVFLARAWFGEKRLLILDEPCSGLDVFTRETLLTTINDLAATKDGPSIIYVTHHIEEVVPNMTHTLLLKGGKELAKGPKKEVITKSNLEKAFQIPLKLTWEADRPWLSVTEPSSLVK